MTQHRRIVHVLDDLAMGGVTRALQNFEHLSLNGLGVHETVDIRKNKVRATSSEDIAIVHFTANWKKLAWLGELRLQGGFSRIILIEHSYTAGYERSEVSHKPRFRLMLKLAYSLVDTVVAVSNNQRDWILDHKLASEQKVVAIPQSRPCTDLLKLAPTCRQSGPLRLRAFGRFHKQKGFDLLIEAMSRIPAELAALKIAGTGPDEELLRSLASDLPHVEICAPFSSPEAFLSEADVIAIPSRWEAFGLVGTEARAAGRPIIAAYVDGLIDQTDRNSFSHTPHDVQSIVEAILAAINTDDLSIRGQCAQIAAAGEYQDMIGNWCKLLEQT